MNTTTPKDPEVKFNPWAFYGTLIALVVLAYLATTVSQLNVSAQYMAGVEADSQKVLLAIFYRLLFLVPIHYALYPIVGTLLGRNLGSLFDEMRDHNNNDSVNVIINYLTLAFAFVIVKISLADTFFVVFMTKSSIMLGTGVVLSTLMNIPFYGINGKEFVERLGKVGSDAVARNVGFAFLIAALISGFFK